MGLKNKRTDVVGWRTTDTVKRRRYVIMMRIVGFLLMALISIPSYADGAVVARVNDVSITSSELEAAVDYSGPQFPDNSVRW